MCGYYSFKVTEEELNDILGKSRITGFRVVKQEKVSPGEWIVIVKPLKSHGEADQTMEVGPASWGFIAPWEKNPKKAIRPVNARAETVATNGLFKRAFRESRCLIPASGFFEYRTIPGQKKKLPVHFVSSEGGVIFMAGVQSHWERSKESPAVDDSGPQKAEYVVDYDRVESMDSMAIITTEPNDVVREVHNRMPVILPRERWDAWLDPTNKHLDELQRFLVPCPDDRICIEEKAS